MRGVLTVREHEQLQIGPRLTERDAADLEEAVGKVLKRKHGGLAASNHVGVLTTRRGLVLEILPKIDLGGEADPAHEKTRQTFLRMLRCWRGLSEALSESGIRAILRFPMLDVFVRQFLVNVTALTRAGLPGATFPSRRTFPICGDGYSFASRCVRTSRTGTVLRRA